MTVAVQSRVIKDSADDLIQPQANKQVAKRAIDTVINYNYGTQYGWPGNGGSGTGGPGPSGPNNGGPGYGGPGHSGPYHGGPGHSGPYPVPSIVPYPGSSYTERGISEPPRYSVSTYPASADGVTIYKPTYGVTIERKETIYPGSGYHRISIPTYPGSGYGGHTSYQPGYGGHNSGQFGYREAITSHRHNALSDPIDGHSSYGIPTIMRRGGLDEDTSTPPSTTITFPDS